MGLDYIRLWVGRCRNCMHWLAVAPHPIKSNCWAERKPKNTNLYMYGIFQSEKDFSVRWRGFEWKKRNGNAKRWTLAAEGGNGEGRERRPRGLAVVVCKLIQHGFGIPRKLNFISRDCVWSIQSSIIVCPLSCNSIAPCISWVFVAQPLPLPETGDTINWLSRFSHH